MRIIITLICISCSFPGFGQGEGKKPVVIRPSGSGVSNGQPQPKDSSVRLVTNNSAPIRLSSRPVQVVGGQTIEKGTQAIVNSDSSSLQSEIDHCNYMITAIETKINWVRSNPEENKKAIESGWYDQMEKYLAEYRKRREELINQSK